MKYWITFLTLNLTFLAAPTLGHTKSPSYSSYNQIVDKLQRNRDGSYRGYHRPNRWTGRIHAGVGLSQVAFQSSSSDGDFMGTGHRGLFLGLGMELGKSNWAIEGNFKNLGKSEGDQTTHNLREFNVNTFFKSKLSKKWNLRTGAGIDFRWLNIQNSITNESASYFTPGLLILVGLDTFVTKTVSLGIDLNYKNAFSQKAIDHRSFDVSLRADIHF